MVSAERISVIGFWVKPNVAVDVGDARLNEWDPQLEVRQVTWEPATGDHPRFWPAGVTPGTVVAASASPFEEIAEDVPVTFGNGKNVHASERPLLPVAGEL